MNIGKNIAEFRKTKGVTQETLAAAIGVSPQAVSKWESGGSPDIELLPSIADFFAVSIDRLFDREMNDYTNIQKEIVKSIMDISASPDYGARIARIFQYCWLMEASIMDGPPDELMTVDQVVTRNGPRTYSQMTLNKGLTSLSFNEVLRYFIIMPEPDEGWKQELHYDESFRNLFATLADEKTLQTIFFLYSRPVRSFTPKLLNKEVGISEEKAQQVLQKLLELKLLKTSGVDLDGEIITVYQFSANIAFIPFLTFAREILQKPNTFVYWTENRDDTNPLLG